MIFHHFAVLWDRAFWKVQNPMLSVQWYKEPSVQLGIMNCGLAMVGGTFKMVLLTLKGAAYGGFNKILKGESYTACSEFLSGLIDHKLEHINKPPLAINPTPAEEEEIVLRSLVAESLANEGVTEPQTFLLQNIIVSAEKLLTNVKTNFYQKN